MSKRTTHAAVLEAVQGLHPNEIVRKHRGPKFFGLEPTQLEEALEKKLVPPPFKMVEGGRAEGWTGQQIIDHHRQRIAAALADEQINPKQL